MLQGCVDAALHHERPGCYRNLSSSSFAFHTQPDGTQRHDTLWLLSGCMKCKVQPRFIHTSGNLYNILFSSGLLGRQHHRRQLRRHEVIIGELVQAWPQLSVSLTSQAATSVAEFLRRFIPRASNIPKLCFLGRGEEIGRGAGAELVQEAMAGRLMMVVRLMAW